MKQAHVQRGDSSGEKRNDGSLNLASNPEGSPQCGDTQREDTGHDDTRLWEGQLDAATAPSRECEERRRIDSWDICEAAADESLLHFPMMDGDPTRAP